MSQEEKRDFSLIKLEELYKLKDTLNDIEKRFAIFETKIDEYMKNRCTDHNQKLNNVSEKIDKIEQKTERLNVNFAKIATAIGILTPVLSGLVVKLIK